MQLVKFESSGTVAVGILEDDQVFPLDLSEEVTSLADIFNANVPAATAESLKTETALPVDSVILLAP
ncbi:MAG: DUF2437 domain-containing protein, partial [Planctomycetaceae bacterium]|nr:DUF2437 domain-containing protein [Planctomycetaceae bacterium]